MNVAFDIDGIIANFAYAFSTRCREIYGNHIPIIKHEKEILNWDWWHFMPITQKKVEYAFKTVESDVSNFWENLPLLDKNSWEKIKDLQKYDKLNIYFITSRNETSEGVKSTLNQTIDWLSKNGWRNPQVIIAKDKGKICDYLNISYFIDDKFENCESVKNACPKCKVYILDYPFNRVKTNLIINRINKIDDFLIDLKETYKKNHPLN